MRALQRIASACLCLPLAVALVPAAAFAASSDGALEAADSGIHLHTQSTCPDGDHKWVWYTQPGSDYLMNGVCVVCETPITNKVSVPISGNRTSGEIKQLIDNNVSKFKEDNAGVGINDVEPAVVLELRGDTTIDVDADMSAVSFEQNVAFSGGKYNLTIKGDGKHTLEITNDGIRIGGTFTMESGKAHVKATSGTALYAAAGIVLSGGELAVEGNLYGMLSGGDITMKDPARLDAQAGFANSSFAAISSFGSISVESGFIKRARGAHGIYSKGDITISGGEVNASVNTDGNSEPAIFAVGNLTIDPAVMEYVIPIGATTGMGTLNSGISAQAESGATVTDNGLNAPVVRVVDNVTRDDAFYENFGKQDASGGNGSGTDGEGSDGSGNGQNGGNGSSDGTGGTGTGGNGNGDGNGTGGNGAGNGNGNGDGSGADGTGGNGEGNGDGSGNSGTGSGSDGAGTGSDGSGTGTGAGGAGTGNGADGTGGTNADGTGTGGTGSGGNNGSNSANGSGTSASGSGSSSSASGSADASALAASASGEGDASGATFRGLKLYAKTVKKNSIKLKWSKVSGAKYYVVLGTKCGTNNRYQIIDDVTGTSYTDSGLKKNTYYRYYIVAFNAQNRILAKSKTIHAATKGGKYTNAKKVTVGRKLVTMRKGTTFSMNASFTKVSNKAKLKQHVKMRYESSNKSVATVTKKGKVTAKGKAGSTCTIYAYAQNGLYATTKVTII